MSGSGGGGGVGALNCVRLYAMQRHITIRDSLKHQKNKTKFNGCESWDSNVCHCAHNVLDNLLQLDICPVYISKALFVIQFNYLPLWDTNQPLRDWPTQWGLLERENLEMLCDLDIVLCNRYYICLLISFTEEIRNISVWMESDERPISWSCLFKTRTEFSIWKSTKGGKFLLFSRWSGVLWHSPGYLPLFACLVEM